MTKVITLHQPWAMYVSLGWKTIETRRHGRFRSLVGQRIGIHASKTFDEVGYALSEGYLNMRDLRLDEGPWLMGAIICTAYVREMRKLYGELSEYALCRTDGLYGYFLEDVRQLVRPTFVRGKQGIWNYDLEDELWTS